jgi:hypothetical protein
MPGETFGVAGGGSPCGVGALAGFIKWPSRRPKAGLEIGGLIGKVVWRFVKPVKPARVEIAGS